MFIDGSEQLQQIHAGVLEHVGIDQAQFSADFNGKLSPRQIQTGQVTEFREYYEEIASPGGYLCKLFDWYRCDVDSRLERPIVPRAKAGLIWALTSYATAQCIRAEQLGPNKITPYVSEVTLLATIRPDLNTYNRTRISLWALSRRELIHFV